MEVVAAFLSRVEDLYDSTVEYLAIVIKTSHLIKKSLPKHTHTYSMELQHRQTVRLTLKEINDSMIISEFQIPLNES